MPLPDRAENLLALLEAKRVLGLPTIFITHSYGGLVIKQLWHLMSDRPELKRSKASIRGIVFLATPHAGARLATYLKLLFLVRPSITIGDLKYGTAQLRQLSIWYSNHAIPLNVAFCETLPTRSIMGFGVKVVDEISANPNVAGVFPIPVLADHIAICKPTSAEDIVAVVIHDKIQTNMADFLGKES
jgi:hypothetical protein